MIFIDMKIRTIGLMGFGLMLASTLRAGSYSSDWDAFVKKIDEEYPFFELKGIKDDWRTAKSQLTKQAGSCANDEEFLGVVREVLACLRDAHSGFLKTRVPLPPKPTQYCLPFALMPATGNRVVVMSASAKLSLSTGTEIRSIDGKAAREVLDVNGEKLWKMGGGFSSPQRARMLAYRQPLGSAEVTDHLLIVVDAAGEREIRLKNNQPVQGWAHTYNMPPKLRQAEGDCYYGKLEEGIGYIYLRRVQGDQTARGIDMALTEQPDAYGWIVDLRGNGGGGYDQDLLKVIEKFPQPVTVIIDAGCMSAGETLARDFRRLTKARIIGDKSAGASSAKQTWSFPSGIATLTLSTRSRFDDGQPIEFNGIDPDEMVEVMPDEVKAGANSEILRAKEYLIGRKS
jgi:hypothetical protein